MSMTDIFAPIRTDLVFPENPEGDRIPVFLALFLDYFPCEMACESSDLPIQVIHTHVSLTEVADTGEQQIQATYPLARYLGGQNSTFRSSPACTLEVCIHDSASESQGKRRDIECWLEPYRGVHIEERVQNMDCAKG